MENMNGLLRIICLDAHVPGKLMTIKVGQHANLSGTNGAGKTTLLKLTPFFYGSSPTDVVPRKSTRTRFVDYYLPRPTSMIIYEYHTNTGLMCAVAYRHASGEKPAYRFLAEGFCGDYFSEIREGKRCYVEGNELGRLWKNNNLEHSKQIEVTIDYRAVIQGDAELINRAGDNELRKLAIRFSLSGGIGKMRYIDKMATAILGRSGDMDRIKSMIADIMQEDNVMVPTINIHRGIKNEITSLGILRDLDRNEELFNSVILKGISFQENTQSIGRIYSELSSIKQKLTTKISVQENSLNDLNEAFISLNTSWEDRSLVLNGNIAKAKSESVEFDRRLDFLDKAYRQWEDNDIHKKVADYAQLDHFKSLCEDAHQRLIRLEEGVGDIQRQFNEATAHENARHNNAAGALKEKIRDLEINIGQIREKFAERRVELTQDLSREKDRIEASFHAELESLRDKIAQTKYESINGYITPEERLELDIEDARYDELRILVSRQDDGYKKESQKLNELKGQRKYADEALAKATRSVEVATIKREEMLLLCRPEKGSVLAEFRDNQPSWHDTIGRVIRPELLTRKDLSPVLSHEPGNALFGWQLNLDRIEKPEWATTLEDQERRLRLCDDNLDQAIAYQKDCASQLDKANKAFSDQRDISDEAERKLSRLKAQLEATIEAIKQVKQRHSEAAANRKQEAKLLHERLQLDLNGVIQRKQQAIASAKERNDSIISEGMSQAATNESRLNNEAQAYRNILSEEIADHSRKLKTLKSDYDAQRSERGLDEKVISEAEAAVKETKTNAMRVEGYLSVVAEYHNWVEVEWKNRDTLVTSLSDAQIKRDSASELFASEEADYKRQRDRLNAERREKESGLRTDRLNNSECAALMTRLGASPSPAPIVEPRSFEIVKAEADMLISERIELKKDIRHGVSKAESLILKAGDDSQIANAWHALVQVEKDKLSDCTNEDIFEERLALNKTFALDELLRIQLTQLRESLALFIENAGQQINQYYLGMRDISSAIKSQSRQISDSIGHALHFDAISELKVSLKSKVDSEDYWPTLESFHDTWSSWKENGNSSIPPPEVDQHLMRASEILHRSNLNRPLSGLFDLEISLCENGRRIIARKAEELEDASSTGLSYLILCCIYAGISRMLCRDPNVKIHWPMDELGTLAPENITRLFAMLDAYGIVMIGGFPTTDPVLLQHFTFHHDVQTSGGIVEMALPEDELAQAIAERNATAIEA